MRSAPTLTLELGRLRRMPMLIGAASALAAVAPWFAALEPELAAGISATVVLVGWRAMHATNRFAGLRISHTSEARWLLGLCRAAVHEAGSNPIAAVNVEPAEPVEAELLAHVLLGPIASLTFKLADGRRYPVLVAADAVPAESWRKLRALLKTKSQTPRNDLTFQ